MSRLVLMLLLIVTGFSSTVFAASTTLSWDASPTPEVEYYRVYQVHPSGEQGIMIDGVQDLIVLFDTPAEWYGTYEYYVTANLMGEESDPSNSVSTWYGKPHPPHANKPVKNK
jgi:hypothetical protein